MKSAPFVTVALAVTFLSGCADMPKRDPRDVARDCPVGMVQVCEGDHSPTRPGDEAPVYERCRCETVTM